MKNVFSRYSSAYALESGDLSENSRSETQMEGLSKSPLIKDTPYPSTSSDLDIKLSSTFVLLE